MGCGIQNISWHFLGFFILTIDYGLQVLLQSTEKAVASHPLKHTSVTHSYFPAHQVDIAELVQPEVVDGCGNKREVVFLEALVGIIHGNCEATQDPPVHGGLLSCELWAGWKSWPHAHLYTHTHTLTSSMGLGVNPSPSPLMENFMAFHILLQKCLYPTTRFTSRLMFLPWAVYTHRANRIASVPHSGMPSG